MCFETNGSGEACSVLLLTKRIINKKVLTKVTLNKNDGGLYRPTG